PKRIDGLGGRKDVRHRAVGNAGTGQRPMLPGHNLATTPLGARAPVFRSPVPSRSSGGRWSHPPPESVPVVSGKMTGRTREKVDPVSTKAVQGRPSILQRRWSSLWCRCRAVTGQVAWLPAPETAPVSSGLMSVVGWWRLWRTLSGTLGRSPGLETLLPVLVRLIVRPPDVRNPVINIPNTSSPGNNSTSSRGHTIRSVPGTGVSGDPATWMATAGIPTHQLPWRPGRWVRKCPKMAQQYQEYQLKKLEKKQESSEKNAEVRDSHRVTGRERVKCPAQR
ncbi:unnamed protein product, partial [Gadus morhua 'NCC']